MSLADLSTKIYADGAVLEEIRDLSEDPYIRGFTTNPTLMRKAGVPDYVSFAREVLDRVTGLPVSFEVLSDDKDGMRDEALEIATWASNVYVKVPITNTRGDSTADLVRELSHSGVKVNVTGILALPQVETAALALAGGAPAYVSVFAGRIADTGRDPVPLMAKAVEIVSAAPGLELIWASPREILNLIQADGIGCHVITMTIDLLQKLHLLGRDLTEYSLETVQMFHRDGAGLSIGRAVARS